MAVIGAGPSGTAVLHAFRCASANGIEIPEIVCYEKQDDWGGLWNFSWRTGLDEHAEPVHCSMYRHLWSNGPKECLEFADYSFEEHFGAPIASYPPRAVLCDYIKGRVEKAGVRPWVRFHTSVRRAEYSKETGHFTVTAEDLRSGRESVDDFDFLVVATGHFSTPSLPEFPGFHEFSGRILHSHDFRDAMEFKGQDVLIIGRSYSAEDIGLQCHKYGARSIILSYRSAPIGFMWPSNWEEKPLLERLVNRTAYFRDGSSREIDAVILCTGYLHHFPFLPKSLRLESDNRLWPQDLYKGVVFEATPQLHYIGMQDQYYSFTMFDAQAWFSRDVILNRIPLPDLLEMRASSAVWRAREARVESTQQAIEFQGDYVKDLIELTDCPRIDVDAVNAVFKQWERHKADSILEYRDNSYRSIVTGTMSPAHHTPWLYAMDDSLATYIGHQARPVVNRKA